MVRRPMCDSPRPWSAAVSIERLRFSASVACGALLILLSTSGCDRIPRDPDGTLERVAAEGSFRVGVISPGPDWSDAGSYDAFLRHLAQRTRAQPRIVQGPTERLLSGLEDGELDLVIGELSAESPWRSRVTMLPPLEAQRSAGPPLELTVAARNGENAWIATLFDATTATHLKAPTP
jgi:hypothetical protein